MIWNTSTYGPDNPKTMPTGLDLFGVVFVAILIYLLLRWMFGAGGDAELKARKPSPGPGLHAGTGAPTLDGDLYDQPAPTNARAEGARLHNTRLANYTAVGKLDTHSEPITGRDLAESLREVASKAGAPESEKSRERAR